MKNNEMLKVSFLIGFRAGIRIIHRLRRFEELIVKMHKYVCLLLVAEPNLTQLMILEIDLFK